MWYRLILMALLKILASRHIVRSQLYYFSQEIIVDYSTVFRILLHPAITLISDIEWSMLSETLIWIVRGITLLNFRASFRKNSHLL